MAFPTFTDLELFLMTGWVSYIIIRLLADSVKLRLYIDFKDWKVKVGKPIPQSRVGSALGRALGRKSDVPNTHIHHFVIGMLLMPFTFYALYWHYWVAPILAGIVMALVFSEIKELVLMNWGQ
jgi:hypothetical protein